jgi:nucleotide-binding universal stress UspA family protein
MLCFGRQSYLLELTMPLYVYFTSNSDGIQDLACLAQSIRYSFDRVHVGKEDRLPMNVQIRILDGELSEVICSSAREVGADLVIVGRGHVRERFAQMWSHLYTIIRDAPCPVLSV